MLYSLVAGLPRWRTGGREGWSGWLELLRCLSHLFCVSQSSILASPAMTRKEVGTVPGSYRIVDMFCLREEVLNQIMKVGVMNVPFLFNLFLVVMQVRARLLFLPEQVGPPPPCPPSTACWTLSAAPVDRRSVLAAPRQ